MGRWCQIFNLYLVIGAQRSSYDFVRWFNSLKPPTTSPALPQPSPCKPPIRPVVLGHLIGPSSDLHPTWTPRLHRSSGPAGRRVSSVVLECLGCGGCGNEAFVRRRTRETDRETDARGRVSRSGKPAWFSVRWRPRGRRPQTLGRCKDGPRMYKDILVIKTTIEAMKPL